MNELIESLERILDTIENDDKSGNSDYWRGYHDAVTDILEKLRKDKSDG